jgi:putative NADPH-quinone reductase
MKAGTNVRPRPRSDLWARKEMVMLFQVIHCHPLIDSYNHALFQTIVAALESRGHEVIATDLYRAGFEPAMRAEERRTYDQEPYDATAVAALADLLRRVDGIVLCFRHWWFSMPAMLKGYFDRVWGPGIAFTHDPAAGRIRPLLTNIRVFGVVTSYGSPWWITRLAGNPGRKVLMRALKPMCGPRVRSFYLAHYDMDRSTAASRAAFIERVRARLSAI